MELMNPVFLWGLLALVIPVIIHLFNFRRFRRVYFTNVRFIRDLQQKTQKHSQLLHLVILFLRLLAIASLLLVFAQPYIPRKNTARAKNPEEIICIYIDNSFSMEAVSAKGHLIDVAKNKARDILAAYPSSALFQILTNDFEGRHQRLLNKDEILQEIEAVKFSPAIRTTSEVLSRQADLLYDHPGKNLDVYLISDFQKSIADISELKADSLLDVYFIPLTSNKTGNLYIDSCWFESPVFQINQYMLLKARVKNSSAETYEKIPVKLLINGKQRAIASFNVEPGETAEIELPYTITETGVQSGILEITDYPVTYDDKCYFSCNVSESIPVLCINALTENIYLNALFSDSAFAYVNAFEKNLDYSAFSRFNLIILNELKSISSGLAQELNKFVMQGGSLAIVPAEELNLDEYKEFLLAFHCGYFESFDTLDTRISGMDLHHPLFEGVFADKNQKELQENIDLPSVFKHYRITSAVKSSQQTLLELQNGNIFTSAATAGKGDVYLFAVPFRDQYSYFPRHALFVPVIYNMALLSEPKQKLYYLLGSNEPVSVRNKLALTEDVYRIKDLQGKFEFIPEHRQTSFITDIFVHNQITEAGNYLLYDGDQLVSALSFNFDRRESDLNYYTLDELQEMISGKNHGNLFMLKESRKPLSQIITELNQGIKLWKLFVLLALLLLLTEVILLRFWK